MHSIQTGWASERIGVGSTCNNIHRQGMNRTTMAPGLSSREKRLRPVECSVSATVTIATATTAETTPVARMPSSILSAGIRAISEVSMMNATIISPVRQAPGPKPSDLKRSRSEVMPGGQRKIFNN